MKTKGLIFCMALVYALINLAMSGCTSKGGAQEPRSAGDTPLTLNIKDFPGWTDTLPGGYWKETYNDNCTSITIDQFVFSHLPAGPGSSWSGSYWDGFTIGTNGDNRNYGLPVDSSGSADWVNHQWGCMAGGAADTTCCCRTVKGDPYLIAYWGYFMEPEYYDQIHSPGTPPPAPMHDLTVHLADYSLFAPLGVLICNHPWPYYGNIYGDGFARPLNKDSDYFKLVIHALDKDSAEVETVEHVLAQGTARGPVQSTCWQWVDLTGLGEDIRWLYFTMESTDADPTWGPNTAVYFCLDKLKVIKQGGTALSGAPETKASTAKPATKRALEVKDCFPIASHTGGDVSVYDHQGKEVLKTTVKAGEKPNLSKLPEGEYRLHHGHRHIPFKKVK
ncbi:MAG: DUF4465 domain-containing protein [Tannerella sp.]|jgi:hypothetical protein|nr:DUF4465 domain-containing protein [Tannerella sp.]